MAYDALNNYVPGDDEPALDEMRYALSQKKPALSDQIPGNSYPAPKATRPLDKAEHNIKSVAANLHPMMMMKSMQDAVKTAVINPLLVPASIAVEAAQGKPAREITGSTFYQPPTTPFGEMFEESLGKAADVAKLPHMGPLVRPAGMRPALTPNDVRVMGAEATRMGRQVRDVPVDYSNAAAGMSRLDPVTNTPTLGARLGNVERGAVQTGMKVEKSLDPIVADIMERGGTSADLLGAMAGQPSYAMRPSGSTLATPQYPSTQRAASMPSNAAIAKLINEVVPEDAKTLSPGMLFNEWDSRRIGANIDMAPFTAYAGARARELYPDAPSDFFAMQAVSALYDNAADYRAVQLGWLNDFMQTPEGQASDLSRVPSPAELEARHEAATQWLYGPLMNYTRRHLGAVGDPLVKLASQGITYLPKSELQDIADYIDQPELAAKRKMSDLPEEGMVQPAIVTKQAELADAQDALQALQQQRAGYRDIAMQQGLEDPAQLPEYARTTRPIEQAAAAVNKLQEEVENLKIGKMYEDVSDFAVTPKSREDALRRIDYDFQQFYPSITRARPDDTIYNVGSQAKLREIGLQGIATEFYSDVMSGKIPIDQVSKLSVDKFVRDKAMPRILKEKEEAKQKLTFKNDAEEVLLKTLKDNTTLENYFGNTAVIELTQDKGLSPEQLTRMLSEPTTVLDHCIGEGGSGGGNTNPWNGNAKRTYLPIYNIVTGEVNSGVGRRISGYATGIANGNTQIADIRDGQTGMPVATLEFNRASYGPDTPRYNIGYVSGFKNDPVAPEYRDGVIAYLNSRADSIASAGRDLENIGAIDTQSASARELANFTGKYVDDVRVADLSQLPRFATREQVRATIEAQPVARTELSLAHDRNQATILADMRTSIETAINNAAESAASAHGDSVGNAVRGVLRGRIAEFLDGARIEDVPAALRSLQTAIMDDEAQFSNSNSTFNNSIADGLIEFIPDLEGAIDYHERRLREVVPAQAPNPADEFDAQLFEPDDQHGANLPAQAPAIDYVGMIDNMTNELAQNQGLQQTERANTVAYRVAERTNPRLDPQGYAIALREAADREPFESVERALYDLADQIETAAAPARRPQQPAGGLEDLARELYADAVVDGEVTPRGLADLRVALFVLDNGQFDHPMLRNMVPEARRPEAMRQVADALREMLSAAGITPDMIENAWRYAHEPEPEPDNDLTRMTRAELVEHIAPDRWNFINARSDLAISMAREEPNPGDFVDAIRNDEMQFLTDGMDMYEREVLAQDVHDALLLPRAQAPAPAPAQAPQNMARRSVINPRIFAETTVALEHALAPTDLANVARLADQLIDVNDLEDLPLIVRLVRNNLMGEWEEFDMTQRELLARLIDEHYNEAGRAPGYQSGGSVKKKEVSTPSLYGTSDYARAISTDMYPGQRGQDDQRDAARHMLAAGTLSRKYGPGTAEFLGKAHEYTTSPVQAVKSLFGGKMPPDYMMDTHNNAMGVQLGQRAKTQQELEDMVQMEAERASRTQIPGRAFINKAGGGIVHTTPSTDQMRLELMMRSK